MSRQLQVKVEKDHIESFTNVSGTTAIMELIWNALDADATEIVVAKIENALGPEEVHIHDNGHGMTYAQAISSFSAIGGSWKKSRVFSPGSRALHGEEGKGRYNAFGLGDLVTYKSFRHSDAEGSTYFQITMERGNLNHPEISDELKRKNDGKTGVEVVIQNVISRKVNAAFSDLSIASIEEKLAVYYHQYPTFKIRIADTQLDFNSLIKNQFEEDIKFAIEEAGNKKEYSFKVRILEWTRNCDKKIYLCNENSVSFGETKLGVHTQGLQVTAYLCGNYIGQLHRQNSLNVGELDVVLSTAIQEVKLRVKTYIRKQLHDKGLEFIASLKAKELYPYKEEPKDEVEKATRQVFDIVALHINEYLPQFSDQDDTSKKFVLTMVREALENDSENFRHVMTEVLNLPTEKIDDLKDLLDSTSLSSIIDTMKEVTDRLRFLYELRMIVLDPEHNKLILERKHLHKILEKNTWIFGDEYALGASDVNLKKVLKAHLKALGRTDFHSVFEEGDNSSLDEIPDVCLWKQYSGGKLGHFRNLVIELKRPTVKAGHEELAQIKSYAQKVGDDNRFVKDKTEWTFVLLVTDIKHEIRNECQQSHRKFGHVIESNGLNVFVVRWTDLFNEVEARHQYLKEKLNYNISEDKEGLELLNARYQEYLPQELKVADE